MASKLWKVAYRARLGTGATCDSIFHAVDGTEALESSSSAHEVADAVDARLSSFYLSVLDVNASLLDITATEVVTPGSGDVPAQYAKTKNSAGLRTAGDNELPNELCALIQLRTDAAVRGAHGWTFAPPAKNSSALASGGVFSTSHAYYTGTNDLGQRLQDNWSTGTVIIHDWEFVIYSRTRHARGLDNYWFSIIGFNVPTKPHWLRSRGTTP